MSDVRPIDAYALEKLFEEECAGECPICSYSHEGCPCGLIKTAPTVELYQGEECVNIKMSEDEIEKFKQRLQERTPLYTITSDTFVEGASTERPTGKWIDNQDNSGGGINCSICGKMLPCTDEYWYETDYCPNCGARMEAEIDAKRRTE